MSNLASIRRRRCAENDALVLGILREANCPLSAYDISYRASLQGTRVVPNQVYRTLTRLIERQLVARIEALNAYTPHQSQGNVCLICTSCQAVQFIDMPGLRKTIVEAAPECRFEAISGLIEAQGQCVTCQAETSSKDAS